MGRGSSQPDGSPAPAPPPGEPAERATRVPAFLQSTHEIRPLDRARSCPTVFTRSFARVAGSSETYAVTRTGLSPSSTTYKLKLWLEAPEGQAVIKKSGYAPYKP